MSADPAFLYHYTTTESVFSILQSSELWLSHARFSLDVSELDYGLDVVEGVINRRVAALQESNQSEILKTLQVYAREKLETYDPFIICFSETPDVLSLWRMFSLEKGVCLGFEVQGLLATNSDVINCFFKNSGALGKVSYDPGEQIAIAEGLVDTIIGSLGRAVKYVDEKHPDEALDVYAVHLLAAAMLFKHPSFQDEREWRLFQFAHFETESDHQALRFRTKEAAIVPAIAVAQEKQPLPLEEIFCAQSALYPDHRRALELLKVKTGHAKAAVHMYDSKLRI
ncbi:DUF2971 domain-containing protein [Alkalispirillum mobile]|uniref:DUF2971 domain-containing protein n=1 Tax=Alkalispirillum mobile TaxID=85925 RepID=UPI0014754577|nr:DUF2971 domain-containing protein [Alkalispirillum mobile]